MHLIGFDIIIEYHFLFKWLIWLHLFRIADAEENLGESEVREAHLAKSLFFIRIGDKVDIFETVCSRNYVFFLFSIW